MKKHLGTIVGGILIFLLFTSCNKKEDPALEGKIKVVWWVEIFDDTVMLDAFIAETVGYFNENNDKGIYVEAIPQPNHWEAVRTSLAGGAGPDIIQTPGPNFARELANSDKLYSLDNYAINYNWKDRLMPWAYELGQVNETLYSLPSDMEGLLLFYNKTVLEKNGWSVPKNMDEFMQLMGEIKQAGLIPNAAGNTEWKADNEHYVGEFFNAIAGPQKIYDALTGKAKLTDPEFVKAIDTLTEAMTSGYWAGDLETYYITGGTEKFTDFAEGRAVFFLTGSWVFGHVNRYFEDTDNEWGWIPTPSNFSDFFSVGSGNTFAININSKEPDAAAEFINYLFLPETQARLISKVGAIPYPIKMDKELLSSIEDPRYKKYILDLLNSTEKGYIGYLTWVHYPPKTQTYLWQEIEKVWAGLITTEEYLTGAQTLLDEEILAGEVPPIPKPAK